MKIFEDTPLKIDNAATTNTIFDNQHLKNTIYIYIHDWCLQVLPVRIGFGRILHIQTAIVILIIASAPKLFTNPDGR